MTIWLISREIKELVNSERKIGIPPPLGTIPLCVWAGWNLFFLSVTKPIFLAKIMVGIVSAKEIKEVTIKTNKFCISIK